MGARPAGRALTRRTKTGLPRGRPFMPRDIVRGAEAFPAASVIALALGAAAFGAVAVGALAIGRLDLGPGSVKGACFQALEVDELSVRQLRVRESEGPRAYAESHLLPQ